MYNVGMRNIYPLQAINFIFDELTKFLDGWSYFRDVDIKVEDKKIIIIINPKLDNK